MVRLYHVKDTRKSRQKPKEGNFLTKTFSKITDKVELAKLIKSDYEFTTQPVFDTADITTGLVPIGDTGLFSTPEEPADPTDCERWPDSPFCGGNPFAGKVADLGIEIVRTECDRGFTANPVLGFIKLPPVSVVYRKPECRNVPERFEPDPDADFVEFPPEPCKPQSPCSTVFYPTKIEFVDDFFYDPEGYFGEELGIGAGQYYRKVTYEYELIRFEFPYKTPENTNLQDIGSFGKILTYLTFSEKVTLISNDKAVEMSTVPANFYGYPVPITNYEGYRTFDITVPEAYSDTDLFYPEITSYSGQSFGLAYNFLIENILGTGEGQHTISEGVLYQSAYEFPKERLKNKRNSFGSNEVSDNYGVVVGYHSEEYRYRIEVKCSSYIKPPPLKDICCMPQCCTPPNNDLLKSLIKKVDKLSKIVGVDEYPASLPASFISKDEGFLGNLIPNAPVEVPNLTKFLSWYVERFDEIMGQFEIPIEVKDSDPTKPGDQPVGFKLPNVAESIAEIMGLLLQSTINSETLVNMVTRTLIETGQDKQQNFKNYMLTQAIVEYMGFETKEKTQKLPMTFKPGGQGLEDMLRETEIDVTISEFADTTDLRANLTDLLQAAAITRAVHWRKLDAKGNMGNQIRDIIKAYSAISETIGGRKKDEEGKDGFEKFIEDAEIGFTHTTGITDTTNPYGASFDQRPKIRELGTPPPPPE